MNLIRAGGTILNLNLVRSISRYQTVMKGNNFVRVVWNTSGTSGTMVLFGPHEIYDDFHEKKDPEMYNKLIQLYNEEPKQ